MRMYVYVLTACSFLTHLLTILNDIVQLDQFPEALAYCPWPLVLVATLNHVDGVSASHKTGKSTGIRGGPTSLLLPAAAFFVFSSSLNHFLFEKAGGERLGV